MVYAVRPNPCRQTKRRPCPTCPSRGRLVSRVEWQLSSKNFKLATKTQSLRPDGAAIPVSHQVPAQYATKLDLQEVGSTGAAPEPNVNPVAAHRLEGGIVRHVSGGVEQGDRPRAASMRVGRDEDHPAMSLEIFPSLVGHHHAHQLIVRGQVLDMRKEAWSHMGCRPSAPIGVPRRREPGYR
jgi:hypothetical protein